MADSDDIVGGIETGQPGQDPSPTPPEGDHLRAASGALFVAVLPWAVAGYLLFSWAGQSMVTVVNAYALPFGVAALALGAFSLWQVAIAARHLLAWAMAKPRG